MQWPLHTRSAVQVHILVLLIGSLRLPEYHAEDFWGDAACFTSSSDVARGPEDAERHYNWCCLSFCREYLGHPLCWSSEKEISAVEASQTGEPSTALFTYERCCLVPRSETDSSTEVRLETLQQMRPWAPSLGLTGATLGHRWTEHRHLDLHHPRLAHFRFLQGCDTATWDEILFAIKIRGGCLPCATPPHELQHYLGVQADGCIAGQLLLAFSRFIAVPEEHAGEPTAEAKAERAAVLGFLALLEAELWEAQQNSNEFLFDLLGVTPTQIRYVLHQTSLRDDYSPFFEYKGSAAEADQSRLRILDLGMSGGMDSLFYVVHGFQVLAVEANPFSVIDVRAAMRRYAQRTGTGQLRVLNAALVSDEERAEMAGAATTAGKLGTVQRGTIADALVANALAAKPGKHVELGVEVPFHIHRDRPDFSALDGSRVPQRLRAGTVPVRAVTCAELVSTFGRPYGVKIDAEGADHACLISLKRAGVVPRYLSTELPNLLEKDGTEEATALVELLVSMGYSEFKLCRQTLYNARTVLAIDQFTNRTEIVVSRQGLGYGAAGPFGEAAVDWLMGPRWRSAASILPDLIHGGPVWVAATMHEWFDLHVRQRE